MKLGKVLAWEFRRTVRGKQFLIMTILIPAILGISAGGYALFGGTREAPAGPPPPFLAPLVISMILFFGAFLNGAMSLYAVIKEKSSRVVEIVLSSVSARELMAGKVLGQGAAGLIQVILWGAIAIVVLGRLVPGLSWELSVVQWISYPLYFVLGFLLIATLYATVAAGMKDVQSGGAQSLIGMIPYIPMLFVQGMIEHPNEAWVRILSFFPPFTPAMMMIRVSVVALPWWEVAASILILAAFDFFFIRVAARAFETAMLMYGKPVSLRELWRWGIRRQGR